MITSNVIQKIFFIKFYDFAASSFTVEKNDKQYLATVRHLFKADSNKPSYPFEVNHGDEINLSIFHNDRWEDIICEVYFHEHIDIDIAVLQLPSDISPRHKLEPNSYGLLLSQNTYFLGFPYQMFGDAANLNRSFPFPFVKQAIFSAYTKGTNGEVIFFFDGHNNPGFSGGPIVFQQNNRGDFKICAVVRGYIEQEGQIEFDSNVANYTENSGIIVGYNIKHLIEIIENID